MEITFKSGNVNDKNWNDNHENGNGNYKKWNDNDKIWNTLYGNLHVNVQKRKRPWQKMKCLSQNSKRPYSSNIRRVQCQNCLVYGVSYTPFNMIFILLYCTISLFFGLYLFYWDLSQQYVYSFWCLTQHNFAHFFNHIILVGVVLGPPDTNSTICTPAPSSSVSSPK